MSKIAVIGIAGESVFLSVDVLATPQLNNYMNTDRVQLNICDVRLSY